MDYIYNNVAVAPMVSIGNDPYSFLEVNTQRSCRDIYRIPIRIVMCNIDGIDICGGKYL